MAEEALRSSDTDSEPEELSLGSYSAQASSNPLIASTRAIIDGIRASQSLDAEALEALIATLFVEIKSKPERHICWYFPDVADDYRALHSLNAARLAMYFASQSGMQDSHVVQLGIVALLYDVGVYDDELNFILEERKLSSVEFNMVEEISLRGAEILAGVEGIDPLCELIAREHHERADGTGYPDRTRADEQHPYSRLLQIIDSFLGMIEPRKFRAAITPIEAMQRLAVQAHRGYYYEAAFRDWLKVMGVYPVGSFVKLNSGEVALIRKSGGEKLRRPEVDILTDDLLDFRARPFLLDMSEDSDVEIASAIKDYSF